MDPNFASFSKLEQTQLCLRFNAVPRDREAPNGVEKNRKRCAAKHSYEIIGADSSGTLILIRYIYFNLYKICFLEAHNIFSMQVQV